jgi:hypothetical protein
MAAVPMLSPADKASVYVSGTDFQAIKEQEFSAENLNKASPTAGAGAGKGNLKTLTQVRSLCARYVDTASENKDGDSSHSKKKLSLLSQSYDKILLDLGTAVLPSAFAKCPSQRDVESDVVNEKFHVSIHDVQGYDFTTEFTAVYKSRSGKESRYNDYVCVLSRAMLTVDPDLKEAELEAYAQYVLRVARWELLLCDGIMTDTMKQTFPQLDAAPSQTRIVAGTSYSPLRIYVGKSGANVAVWIRIPATLARIEDPKAARAPAETNAQKIADQKREDTLLRQSSAVYYRKYTISMAAVNENINATLPPAPLVDPKTGKQTFAPPPPPPKIGPLDEIRLYISMPTPPASTAQSEEAQSQGRDDEDNDADAVDEDLEGVSLIRASAHHNVPISPRANQQQQRDTDTQTDTLTDDGDTVKSHTQAGNQDAYLGLNTLSPCCELYGWGHNMYSSLGCGSTEEHISDPRPIPLSAFVPLERVRMIACSPRHTLLLTQMGSVFGCGDNTEGCLGLGDAIPRFVWLLCVFDECDVFNWCRVYVKALFLSAAMADKS